MLSMTRLRPLVLLFTLALAARLAHAQQDAPIIVDTDVGDDVDDAFAIDLVLASPELRVLGLSSAWGDTALRAQMLDRMVCETGKSIAVHTGVPTKSTTTFTQAAWAKAGIKREHGDAVVFLLDQIKAHPDQITLLALGPLTNLGAAIDRDPATFRKLKRIVLMGGAIHRGYGAPGAPAEPEYNIARDPKAAQKVFRAEVPIFMLPLDSTQIKFDASRRSQLTTISTPMTDALQVLQAEWSRATGKADETLFDAVAAAYAVDSASCPMTPLHIEVDDKGMTRATPGAPNAQACLEPQEKAFFALLMPRLLNQRLVGDKVCLASSAK
jgi:inosine-uridine nucleoside N-ribohydrolase